MEDRNRNAIEVGNEVMLHGVIVEGKDDGKCTVQMDENPATDVEPTIVDVLPGEVVLWNN